MDEDESRATPSGDEDALGDENSAGQAEQAPNTPSVLRVRSRAREIYDWHRHRR